MQFYYHAVSAACRSVMLTAKAVGVTLDKICINLMEGEQLNPEYLAINPQHTVPTLVDGDLVVSESRAICTYLASEYGEDDSLYPVTPRKRIQVDKMLYFDVDTLFRRFGNYVYPVLFRGAEKDPSKLESLCEALIWFNGFLEGHDFCVEDSITVADFVIIASVSTMIETGIDMSGYANVEAWVERCRAQMEGYDTENEEGAKEYGEFAKEKFNL